MENDQLTWFRQVTCDHVGEGEYTQRQFDILKGFEVVATRCLNCHKIMATKIIGFGKSKKE